MNWVVTISSIIGMAVILAAGLCNRRCGDREGQRQHKRPQGYDRRLDGQGRKAAKRHAGGAR